VGSCTEEYRCLGQPFIDYYIFKPLRGQNCKIIHTDAQFALGVDLVFDFAASSSNEKALSDYWGRSDIVICANSLEHVEIREIVLSRLKRLLSPSGVLILTVPNRYRHHPHPIDTMYRPSNNDLAQLFDPREYSIIASNILEVQADAELVPFTLMQRIINFVLRCLKRITALGPGALERIRVKNKVAMIAVRRLG